MLAIFAAPLWACTKKVFLSANKPLTEQMKAIGVNYVIRYSFDLKGETLIIPAGSWLSFDGGGY